jgi:hypothetical protein
MSNLVERLRSHEISPHHGGCADCYGTIMDEAADEIERLSAKWIAETRNNAEMLEALKRCALFLVNPDPGRLRHAIEAAIAKAEGRNG